MITYTLTENGTANKFFDGELVANCLPTDADFLAWCAEGNEPTPYTPVPTPIPDITPRQLRLWLVTHGTQLASIDSVIAGLPEPDKSIAQINWDYASIYKHDNPLVAQIGSSLGMTYAQIEQAFRDASTL